MEIPPARVESSNKVSEMSVAEYAKRKGVEIPHINFLGLPCLHGGMENANKVIEAIKQYEPDLVLLEDAMDFYGKDRVLMNSNIKENESIVEDNPIEIFFYTLTTYLIENKIPFSSFERKHTNLQNAVQKALPLLYQYKKMNSLIYSESAVLPNDNDAWEHFCTAWSNAVTEIKKRQEDREDVMLSHVAPRVLEQVQGIAKAKSMNVALVVGASHKNGFLDAMASRGDDITIEDQSSLNILEADRDGYSSPLSMLVSIVNASGLDYNHPTPNAHQLKKLLVTVTIEQVKEVFMRAKGHTLTSAYVSEILNQIPKE